MKCTCGAVYDCRDMMAAHLQQCEDAHEAYCNERVDLWYGIPPDYIQAPCCVIRKRWEVSAHIAQCDYCAEILLTIEEVVR
jgi:hypothetical protein